MLVNIFSGRDRQSAVSKGSYHFSSPPSRGQQLELAGEHFTIADAWHTPDIYYRGAKFAILVTDDVQAPQHQGRQDNAGAFG